MSLYEYLSRLAAFLRRWFGKKDPEKVQRSEITFEEWLALLKRVGTVGFESDAYGQLKMGFPKYGQDYSRSDGNYLIAREMSDYATTRLALSVKAFQDDVSQALLENDEGYLERAFRTLRRDLGEVLFYEDLEGFPGDLARQLTEKITETVIKWQTEYGRGIRDQFELFPTGSLGEELLWLFTASPPAGMLKHAGKGTERHA